MKRLIIARYLGKTTMSEKTIKSRGWLTPMMYRVTALLSAFVAGISYHDLSCALFLGVAMLQLVLADRKEQAP